MNRNKIKKQIPFHLMLLPGFILILIFNYYPLYGLVIAFQKFNPATGFASRWVGWDNFKYIFNQPGFISTIWNTFYISFFKIIGGIIVPVIFALLLNEVRHVKLKGVLQTLVYLPNFISWVILAGVFSELLSSSGIVNQLLIKLGCEPVNFLGSTSTFPWTLIFTDIWKNFGFGTVVYLAALASISPSLYESAMMDGATRWQQTIHITIPMLVPTIILMLVLALGNVFNAGFDQIFNMYSPIVYETGDIIDTYVYRLGIQNAQYSVATAVGMFKSVVTIILVSLSYIAADKFAGYRVL